MNFNDYKEKRLKESETLKAEYEALAPEYEVKAQLIKLRKISNLSQKELWCYNKLLDTDVSFSIKY